MPRAKDILRLPEVWSRLAKGTPDSLTKASKQVTNVRWMARSNMRFD